MPLKPRSLLKIIKVKGGYKCGYCERAYSAQCSVYRHMKVHTGETACNICMKVFSSVELLQSHKYFHYGETICIQCRRAFTTALGLFLVETVYRSLPTGSSLKPVDDRRSKVVTRNGKYICSICEHEFDRYNACWEHVNQHVGITTCHVCSKIFATSFGLKRHLDNVHANLVKKKR
ncbi:zinc finger protein 354C-like [Neocloeon triangulifer]|uniref:zinc finger protein 354C-like n=1 Tax=Neocloeon triangulifer TaxID=2078957 RepID=UPI00286F50B0|nr:zinc finger protein 354C-like [Neocloeon triangulifer]